MEKRNLRNGQILLNKLNQKKYTYANGIGTEVLSDEQKESGVQPETLQINGDNIVCFAVSEDPNFDEYSLEEDGTFTANGRVVSTGNIKIVKILAGGKRKALLAVAPLDEEAKGVDVFFYNAALDQFKKLASNVVLTGEKIQAGDTIVLPYENITTKERDVKQPDGTIIKEQYDVLDKSGLIEFNTVTCYGGVYGVGTKIGKLGAEADGYEKENILKTLVFVSDKNVLVQYGDEPYDDDDYDEDEDFYDEDDEDIEVLDNEIKPLEGKILVMTVKVRPDGRLDIGTGYEIAGTQLISATRSGRDMVVVTDKVAYLGSYELNNVTALKMIQGYPYLVKNEYDDRKRERTISMANSNYAVKTIVLEETDDRGVIVTEK